MSRKLCTPEERFQHAGWSLVLLTLAFGVSFVFVIAAQAYGS